MKIAVDADRIGIQLLASLTGVEEEEEEEKEGEGKGDDFIIKIWAERRTMEKSKTHKRDGKTQ
jgi:hypothetical protein